MIEISEEEYEKLLADSRRVTAIRNIVEEFYMRRKLLRAKLSDGPNYTLHNMRKITLAKISVIINRGWNG